MKISKTKFVIIFLISGFVFLFITTSLLGSTGPRGFPKSPDSVLRTGSDSPIAWKRVASTIILPVKIILIGPLLLPNINFLEEDPPPPFISIYLIFYWSILALIIHYLLGKLKRSHIIKEYIAYLKNNPHGYWFKARLYGWGWVPVRWQGWLVVAVGIAILVAGIYVGEIDDAPGATLLGFLLMIALIFIFGYWKGEKPRWHWGPPKDPYP